jgi:hypothetical protein
VGKRRLSGGQGVSYLNAILDISGGQGVGLLSAAIEFPGRQ